MNHFQEEVLYFENLYPSNMTDINVTICYMFRMTVFSSQHVMMLENRNEVWLKVSMLLSIKSPSAPDTHLCWSPCQCLQPLLTPLHHIIPLISSISLWAVVYFHHQMPDEICRRCILGSNPHK